MHADVIAVFPKRVVLPNQNELIARAQAGDQDALNVVWSANLRLCVSYARRSRREVHGDCAEDFAQWLALALRRAILKYDPNKGAALATYAYWRFSNARRYFPATVIRLPASYRAAMSSLLRELDHVSSVRDEFDYDQKTSVASARPAVKTALNMASLDAMFLDHYDRPEALCTERPSGLSNLIFDEDNSAVADAIAALPGDLGHIVKAYYGFGGIPEHTFAEIGEHLGTSRQAVHQRLKTAHKQLREALEHIQ